MLQAPEDRVQIDAAISYYLREKAVPLQLHAFRSLENGGEVSGWVALHAYPAYRGERLDRRAFFHRARDTFNAHRLEWIAFEQSLGALRALPDWTTGMLSISQVSLLVPGMLERLLRRLDKLPFAPEQLLLYLVSHDDCDYPEHLAQCTQAIGRYGVRLAGNRFMPEPIDDQRMALDFVRISQPLAHALGASLSHQVAVEQMALRAKNMGARLIAPALPTAQCREQARLMGVAFERLAGKPLPKAISDKSRRLSA
jgi:EAL domain-containing protein (putative c-di-GMP-specific phosphodiesterase class I)